MVLATIYLIVVGEEAYVGSTTRLNRRISAHIYDFKKHINRKLYNAIENIGGWENVDIIILQEMENTCKNDMLSSEKMWINRLNTTLNVISPCNTQEEKIIYSHKWRKNNIENYRKYQREYQRELYHQKNRG